MKKLILLILLVIALPTYAQNYDVYVGSVISRDKDMHANYMLGMDVKFDMHQDRKYLNKLILGFEHSAYMSNGKTYTITSENPITEIPCNCESESLNLKNDTQFIMKKEVRSISLNIGLGVCDECWLKQLYLMSGITRAKHITKIDNKNASEKISIDIDAGLKYFVSMSKGKWFIVPTAKFNTEAFSFGLGAGF